MTRVRNEPEPRKSRDRKTEGGFEDCGTVGLARDGEVPSCRYPAVFNIEADPREQVYIIGSSAWVISQYLRLIGEYQKSLEKYTNPKAVSLTSFGATK